MERIKIGFFAFAMLCAMSLNAQTHEGKTQKEEPKEASKEKEEKKEEVKSEKATPVRKIKTETRTQEHSKLTK